MFPKIGVHNTEYCFIIYAGSFHAIRVIFNAVQIDWGLKNQLAEVGVWMGVLGKLNFPKKIVLSGIDGAFDFCC